MDLVISTLSVGHSRHPKITCQGHKIPQSHHQKREALIVCVLLRYQLGMHTAGSNFADNVLAEASAEIRQEKNKEKNEV